MKNYILKRLGLMVITFFIIIFMIFVFIKLMPNFYQVGLGQDPEVYQKWLENQGYNKPIVTQFFMWIGNIVRDGDFGISFHKNNVPVATYVLTRLPRTIRINIFPFLISVPIGITFGIIAALKKNKLTDHAISIGVVFFISVPMFVVAVLLQYFLVYEWKILPEAKVDNLAPLFSKQAILTRILPIFVLSLGTIAGWTRSLRAELTETLTSEFMLLARAKGLTKGQATVRHALRNAFVPFAPAIIGGFISLLGGSLIIERTFGITGIGGAFLEALEQPKGIPDYPMFMMLNMFYVSIGLLAAIIGDLSYGIIDPRIRIGGGKS
ncbi:ABC transporter permease [Haploplasma axanthum]|nr:ABC transporter permease [Haploplasma axanthum]